MSANKSKIVNKISIKSKFLIMILTIAIICIGIIGFQGLYNGKKSLNKSIYEHLISVKTIKKHQIENYFITKRNFLSSLNEQPTLINAVEDFTSAVDILKTYNVKINQKEEEKLSKYYKNIFIPKLNETGYGEYSYISLMPNSDITKYLQYYYIANNQLDVGKKYLLDYANDKSYYSEIHKKYHNIFKKIINKEKLHNIFLIEPKNLYIVYSVRKETDYATSLLNGPYAQSSLAKVVQRVLSNPDKNRVYVSDFKNYKPSYDFPAAFFATPIYDDNKLVGILAAQISIDDINNIMTSNKQWESEGLGETGETYLIGRDYKMRSDSRELIEKPVLFFKDLNKTTISKRAKDLTLSMHSSILNIKVHSESAIRATEGKSGTIVTTNYLNKKVLSSYAPLKIDDLNWAIIAEKNLNETQKPIKDFQKSLLISATILATLISFYAIFLANKFLSPINIMIKNLKDIVTGKSSKKIELNREDEFGELAKNINSVIDKVNEQNETIDKTTKEVDKLLLNIFPSEIAKRIKKGEKNIAERVPNVTVLFTVLHGFDAISSHLEPTKSIKMLNEIINSFDEATKSLSIEKITTIGDSYMAASGLITPRLDYARRAVELAIEMLKIIDKINNQYHINLSLSIGIDAGEVMSGIVGEYKYVYDIWGDVVNEANKISHEAKEWEIRVTKNVYKQLTNQDEFELSKDLDTEVYVYKFNREFSDAE